ncbi:hypothetical protein ETN89_20910 (plasmid) [Photobacterium damselae subsp. damselae]|uniref:hypothetical protein n=1 Tax=Photobacterium damselae TaxID=38293 RepID=UPI000A30055D|nr:hypothetical protein [Photobacterium damselae]ARR51750.1 hypothetical protein CAY62_20285 [Photobacterium damselae subsp. damselae]QAY37685.1 hypothetical protein ETN89_20910 [Photobacterium damselae subsp. damselae]
MPVSKRKHPKNQPASSASARQTGVKKRISELGSRNNEFSKPQFPYCTKRLLLGFASFIDNPHGYNNQLHDLYYCQSIIYGLQERQRETCVKVLTVLCSWLEVETNQIGVPKREHMDTITHKAVMTRYHQYWHESISLKRYYHTIKLLKMADYLVIDAIFLQDSDILANLDLKDEELPRVYSKAAYKSLTKKFVNIFGLHTDDGVMKSKQRSITKRIKSGLQTMWVTWQSFSDTYQWVKRQKANLMRIDPITHAESERYPQGRKVDPSLFGGNYLTEH